MPSTRSESIAEVARWRRRGRSRRGLKLRSFRLQVMLLVGALLAGMLLAQGAYLNHRKAEIIADQIGQRALSVALSVASIPAVIDAFDDDDPSATIQPIAERIRRETGARYVVVGDDEGIRYAHPLEERLGLPMVGGDNDRALIHGQSYVSEATGSLGEAIRGKTPVFDADGNIVGIVSVGFMLDRVELDVVEHTSLGWLLVALMIVFGFAGAYGLSRHLKRVILGLEPHEIARLAMEKEAILQSIHEGILAVNHEGEITLLNQQGRRFLDLPSEREVLGQPVQDVVPNSRLMEVLDSGERQFDQEMWLGDHPVVVNRVPVMHEGEVEGAVATFRSRREIVDLSQALSAVTRDVDMLRAQAHEFSNKLYTISGLLQLDRVKEALALIHQESERAQAQMAFLMGHVADPVLSGTLMGKLTRARELGVLLEIDEQSSLSVPLTLHGQEVLMTVIGNLLDNACYAAVQGIGTPSATGLDADAGPRQPRVRLFFTDLGEQLLIEVEDNGPGVPPEQIESIFSEGFSTKPGKHRGIGLALVSRLCQENGGAITLEDSELGGAGFTVVLDKTLCREPSVSNV
ncbi:two-component system, CitB family, sensor kinase/two-component system, CitB family, sensor histidine kinase CitS [Franzmannia pantelleriensis]|uniref:histidine kinase n=1 Tax=Franzmannia pantelleriensis TaxID=48727 RepID=A0A1G9UUY5_9GAMM|nr:sensor histidine kinase [Halomonas pantelleriensis]SDM63754.1 two-component system, CitB family, sensor kinase/two-component system, CitB family, sensor histidine kinase CitS [Halomonas pantelleriensis]